MPDDPEISAMKAVSNALSGLDEEARKRVLDWAATRYGVNMSGGTTRVRPTEGKSAGEVLSSGS